eukprot:TRINITY_DN5480_c0_g1_i7.p1 TRINITY_DN5480_c0_g1~~TRINITY_DN5480_c0_g1_i7.p1  ORF type:complete len:117 (-),score=8.85 TRINITY_DN5480_c0_g1_i7:7-357(-)
MFQVKWACWCSLVMVLVSMTNMKFPIDFKQILTSSGVVLVGFLRTYMNQGPQPTTPSQIDTISSVSYTHLRAHETSLHLVCRLLLEKKKKKNTNIHIQLIYLQDHSHHIQTQRTII